LRGRTPARARAGAGPRGGADAAFPVAVDACRRRRRCRGAGGRCAGAGGAVDGDAMRRRCAGHMYAERALRGGRGPLNRLYYDRCVAQGASR
jgi:hypothetical protein